MSKQTVNRQPFHTTINSSALKYIRAIAEAHECGMNGAIELLVERDKEIDKRIEKSVLTEIVDKVLMEYKRTWVLKDLDE